MYNKEQRLAFASPQLSNMSPLISFQSVWKSGMRYHLRITHQLTQKSKWWKKNGNKPLFHVQTPISEPQMRIFPDEFGLKSPLPPPVKARSLSVHRGPSGKLRMCDGCSSFVMGRCAVYTMFPEWKKHRRWIFIATRPLPSPGQAYRMKNHTTSPLKTLPWIRFKFLRHVWWFSLR